MYRKGYQRLRYCMSTYAMLLGIVIAYISFSFASHMAWKLYLEERESRLARDYKDKLAIYLTYEGKGEDILSKFQKDDVTGYISALPLYANERAAEVLTTIFLTDSLPYEVEKKDSIKKCIQMEEPVIILGKGLKNDTYQKGDDVYVKICNEEYKVVDYISADNSGALDYVRFLFYDNLGDNVKKNIDFLASRRGFYLVLKSDTEDLMEFYREKSIQLSGKATDMKYTRDYKDSFYVKDSSLKKYYQYSYIVYSFAIVLIIIILKLWILHREREFAIRRAIGFLKGQILFIIAKEMIGIITMAGIILLFLQTMVQSIWQSDYLIKYSVVNIGIALVFIVITFIVLMIYPTYRIMRDGIAVSIQDREV